MKAHSSLQIQKHLDRCYGENINCIHTLGAYQKIPLNKVKLPMYARTYIYVCMYKRKGKLLIDAAKALEANFIS